MGKTSPVAWDSNAALLKSCGHRQGDGVPGDAQHSVHPGVEPGDDPEGAQAADHGRPLRALPQQLPPPQAPDHHIAKRQHVQQQTHDTRPGQHVQIEILVHALVAVGRRRAQAAADDYLTSIKAANVSMEEEQKAAEKEQMLNGADE